MYKRQHLQRPCRASCPVDAISYNEYGITVIDEEKCIRCGKCIHSCPFGAIGSKTFIVSVIEAIKAGKHVYAMAAPATEGQFGADITMASWKKAMKELGFEDFYDVGLGGDMTAAYEAQEWAEAYKAVSYTHLDVYKRQLVGYTNAGKSTMMNRMLDTWMDDAEKKVLEKNMLFATLDTTCLLYTSRCV